MRTAKKVRNAKTLSLLVSNDECTGVAPLYAIYGPTVGQKGLHIFVAEFP